MGMKIKVTPDPDYKALPQTTDVLINKEVKKLSKRYPDKKFSELLQLAARIVKADKYERGDF